MTINYDRKIEKLVLDSVSLDVVSLADLDKTIDTMFEELTRRGEPDLLDELCPYFGVVWPAARSLASYCESLPLDALADRRILEVGCGLAMPSLVIAKRGAKVVATDFHPEVPAFLQENVTRNQVEGVDFRLFDWRKGAPSWEPFDLIIGSDLIYDASMAKPLADFLSLLVSPGGEVVITDPGRPYMQDFADAMNQRNFSMTFLGAGPGHGDVYLMKFRSNGKPNGVPVCQN